MTRKTKENDYRNPNEVSLLKTKVAQILSSNWVSSNKIAYFFTLAGDILRYDKFCRTEFAQHRNHKSREDVFDDIIALLQDGDEVLEFGVAHGYTTNYFLSRTKKRITYFGFDLFTGLPTNWRNLATGAFSNNGVPPNMIDERVSWVVGDVTQTFSPSFELNKNANHLVIFDLDLLEPTIHVFRCLSQIGVIKSGTLLYFDEAFDPDELSVIRLELMPHYKFRVLGRTWSSIAFQIL